MKRRTKLITGLGVILAAFGAGLGVVFADASNAVVSGTTNHAVYKFGQDVTITGTVNGDIFCAGQTVTVDATVNGDVICAGQTVTVDGTVNGNIRLAGQTVSVGADVKRAASLAGQNMTLQDNAVVGNDLSLAGQTVTVDGRVGRDITGAMHTLLLNGTVGRNVDARLGNKLELQSGAVVGGNFAYTAMRSSVLHRDAAARVTGTQTFHQTAVNRRHHSNRWGIWFAWHTYWGIAMIVMSLILAALFPQLFNRWNKVGRSRVWLTLLIGFSAMIVVPIAVVILFISVVGVPLALLLLTLWAVTALLSGPLAAYYVGSLIMRSQARIPLIMLVGAIVLAVVCLIPVLGWIVTALAYWFGVGELLLNVQRRLVKPDFRVS